MFFDADPKDNDLSTSNFEDSLILRNAIPKLWSFSMPCFPKVCLHQKFTGTNNCFHMLRPFEIVVLNILQISQIIHIEATSNNCTFHVVSWTKIIIKLREICEVTNSSPSAVLLKYNLYHMQAKYVSIGRFDARFY